jgi:hypothetical protein
MEKEGTDMNRANKSDDVFQSIDFPPHKWSVCTTLLGLMKCDQEYAPPGVMICFFPIQASIRFGGSQRSVWGKPREERIPFDPRPAVDWKVPAGDLSTTYYITMEQARTVVVDKEWDGDGKRFISVKPAVPPGMELGVLLHCAVGCIYTTSNLEKAFDQASYNEVHKNFPSRNYLELSLKEFIPHWGTLITMTFLSNGRGLKSGWAENLQEDKPADVGLFRLGDSFGSTSVGRGGFA